MIQKIIGAALILAACGGMGLSFAAAHRQKERMLQQLIAAAKLMMCELQYRHTALPQLMSLAARESGGSISRVFATVRQELERQIAPDAACLEIPWADLTCRASYPVWKLWRSCASVTWTVCNTTGRLV